MIVIGIYCVFIGYSLSFYWKQDVFFENVSSNNGFDCNDSNKYSNMNARVYAKLALDKDNGGDFEDGEFLEISKSIFSSFKLTEGATLEFILDESKFNSSTAKKKIEGLISDIVEAEKDYEKQLSEWEMDKKFSDSEQDDEEHDDVDDEGFNNFLSGYGISSEKEEETEQDLSKASSTSSCISDCLNLDKSCSVSSSFSELIP
jgi:hypothetical protein